MKKYLHYAWVICFGCAFICALTSPIINATATQYLISVTEEFGVSRSAFTLSSTIVALVGMVISFIVSMLAIRFLMGFIKKHDFKAFGWYRIVLGIVVVLYFALSGAQMMPV